MSAKNTNGGCGCESCQFTDNARLWPESDNDQAKLAKYLRAKSTGKMPADSAYSAHKSYALKIFPSLGSRGREFAAAELSSQSVKVYKAPAMPAPVLAMPRYGWQTTAEYIQGFDEANNLKSAAYSFYWGETDMRSAA